jgi:hypothetical protein
MNDPCASCPHERVHDVEYRALNDRLAELKDRVTRVETSVGRGVALLVANLAAIIVALTKGFLTS